MPVRQRERELKQLVRTVTDDFKITTTSGGHYKITLYGPLGSRFVIASGSASDRRASKNLVADLSRAIISLHPVAPMIIQPRPKHDDDIIHKNTAQR